MLLQCVWVCVCVRSVVQASFSLTKKMIRVRWTMNIWNIWCLMIWKKKERQRKKKEPFSQTWQMRSLWLWNQLWLCECEVPFKSNLMICQFFSHLQGSDVLLRLHLKARHACKEMWKWLFSVYSLLAILQQQFWAKTHFFFAENQKMILGDKYHLGLFILYGGLSGSTQLAFAFSCFSFIQSECDYLCVAPGKW